MPMCWTSSRFRSSWSTIKSTGSSISVLCSVLLVRALITTDFRVPTCGTLGERDVPLAMKLNIEGAHHMLELARKYKCRLFIPSTIGTCLP